MVSSHGAELHRTRQTQLRNRQMNIRMFRAAVVCQRLQSDCSWEHVLLETSDDEMWRGNFKVCRQTFVRICGHPAPIKTLHSGDICGVKQKTLISDYG